MQLLLDTILMIKLLLDDQFYCDVLLFIFIKFNVKCNINVTSIYRATVLFVTILFCNI